MQERIVFIQLFAEVIRNHLETGAKFARVELNAHFRRDNSIAFEPPRRVRIAHDLAHALVEQKRLDRSKEWKDQIKAHDEYLRGRSTGLSGRLLSRILVFRASFLSPVELQDGIDADLPDAPLEVGILGCDFPAAQFAFDLDVRALRQRSGKLGKLAKDDAAMPLGLRDVLAALLVLVGGLGCERKCREAAVIGVANFCVAAEESDEVDFVLYVELGPLFPARSAPRPFAGDGCPPARVGMS